ncbi:uncharacterized protein YerC [Rhodococcus sp. PvR044]
MRSDAKASIAKSAMAIMIQKTFDQEDWFHLGAATDTVDLINDHGRLLRSLNFGDDDYLMCIYQVLPEVLGERRPRGRSGVHQSVDSFENLEIVEDHLGLEKWLRDNDERAYRELYGGADTAFVDDVIAAVHDPLTVSEVEAHAQRIRGGLHADPAQAVGSAKELLETVLKSILGLHGTGKETQQDLPKLVGGALDELGMSPGRLDMNEPGAQQRRKILQSLTAIVGAAGELRNAGLGTGHGVSRAPALDPAFARLAVSSAVSAATFLADAAARRAVGDYATPTK